MFETSVAQARAVHRPWLLPVSIGGHAFAIVAIAVASVSSIRLPVKAPNEMALYRIGAPPPPLGDPNGGHPKTASAPPKAERRTAPSLPQQQTAPQTIPQHVEVAATNNPGPETPGPSTGSDQPLGVPWGVKDSVGPIGPPQPVQPLPQPPDVIYRAGVGNVKAPVVLRRVSPAYPRLAIAAHRSGWAIVECTIDKSGRIRDAHVVGSSWEVFEQPALDAVQQWSFTPGTLDGNAVDVVFELRVTFEIH